MNGKFSGYARLAAQCCVVLAVLAASPVFAAIQMGGGDTLPAFGYVGDVSHRLNYAPASRSFFGAYKAVTGTPVSYCQSDSAAGKAVLAGAMGFNVQNPCPDGPAVPTGFGASDPHVNRPDLTQPSFVASDVPLSSTDYSNYLAGRTTGRPLQFPAVAGSIAIVYRNDNLSTVLNLTTRQVCDIFRGNVTTWSALGAPLPASGDDRLKVVYRSDRSGTSFGLSNFLSANCDGTSAQHFVTSDSFANAIASYGMPGSAWIGRTSGYDVANTVVNSVDDGYIAYVEAPVALLMFGSTAFVNGKDPFADLGDATTHRLTIDSADVVYNNVITGVDATTGRPTIGPISGASSTSCIALVKPGAYATLPSSASGYPIVAVSYLLGNSQGNGLDAASVRKLLGAPYNAAIIAATTYIGDGTGLAFLKAPIVQSQVDGCVIN